MFCVQFSSVQSLSHVRLFATPWIAARQAFLFITISQSSLRLTSIESVMPSSHLILCHPLLLLPPIPPSIRVFSNESTLLMRWPKYQSFSSSIIPPKEIPGLISFRMDWLDLLAVQGTLKSLLQLHSSKASTVFTLYVGTHRTFPKSAIHALQQNKSFNKFQKIKSPQNVYPLLLLLLSCFSHVWLCVTPWTAACQAPLLMEFSRQEYYSGLPCLPPGTLPNPGIEPGYPALQADSSPPHHQGSSIYPLLYN